MLNTLIYWLAAGVAAFVIFDSGYRVGLISAPCPAPKGFYSNVSDTAELSFAPSYPEGGVRMYKDPEGVIHFLTPLDAHCQLICTERAQP